MATKKMIVNGSILGKYPNVSVKRHIKRILKEYKEILDNASIEDFEEKIKTAGNDNDKLDLILKELMDLKKEINKNKNEYPPYTLKECFDDFIAYKQKENISKKTLQKYQRSYNKLIEYIKPDKDLNTVSDKDFSDFYDYIVNSDYANETKGYLINNIKLMLKSAYNRHKIKNKLMDRYEFKVNKKERKKYYEFTEQELKKLYKTNKDDTLFIDVMMILLHTGMRIGELANLRVNDINLKEKSLLIASQGGKTENATRLIYIHPKIYNIIKDYKKQSKNEYLIDLEKNVKNRADTLSKKINRGIDKAIQDKRKVVHSFRKNFTQKLYQITEAEHLIKYIIGHSQSNNLTFDTYNLGKVNFKQIKDIISKVDYPFLP